MQGDLHLDIVLSFKEKKIGGTREGCSKIPGILEKILSKPPAIPGQVDITPIMTIYV